MRGKRIVASTFANRWFLGARFFSVANCAGIQPCVNEPRGFVLVAPGCKFLFDGGNDTLIVFGRYAAVCLTVLTLNREGRISEMTGDDRLRAARVRRGVGLSVDP